MEKRAFGKTDMLVSILGFGGAEIGFENASTSQVKDLLASAINQGLNVIDTAECYGTSEEQIGGAVGNLRQKFYLLTKCGHGATYEIERWKKADVLKSIERSLKRLKTDYLDLVQLHSCSEAVLRQGEAIEALQEARKAGKTRYIGYSGDHTDALYAINTNAFDTLQTSVNICDQEALELTLPLAQAKGMGIIAKRPLANAVWRHKSKPSNSYHVPYWERLQKLDYDFIMDNKECAEVALSFTLSVPGVHVAIVGTTKPKHWKENSDILAKGKLSNSRYKSIRTKWQETASKDWAGQT